MKNEITTMHYINIQPEDRKYFMQKSIYFFVACFLLCWTIAISATPKEDTRKGMEAFREGDTLGAMQLYRKAAEEGYAPAQEKLANILDQSELNEEAIFWFRKAAEQNNAEGQYGLGMMYLTGDGIETDTEQGLGLVAAAAEQRLFRAMVSMFHFYKNGDHGLQVDLKQAVYWLEKIAISGNQWAIKEISQAYRQGELGLTVSEEKAIFWEAKLLKKTRSE